MLRPFLWMSSTEQPGKTSWVTKTERIGPLQLALATTIGGPRSRYEENQDVVMVRSEHECVRAVVVDGAGSTATGQRAAIICAEQAQDLTRSLEQVHAQADEQIRRETRVDGRFEPRTSGYGAVVGVDVDLETQQVDLAFWGDCRAVLLRGSSVDTAGTTMPQNVFYDQVLASEKTLEEYYKADGPSYLSGGIGLGDLPTTRPPVRQSFVAQSGDVLVLGSDGVWDQCSDYELLLDWQAAAGDLNRFVTQVKERVFARNNATQPFMLQVSEHRSVEFCPDAADNTSLVVLKWEEERVFVA